MSLVPLTLSLLATSALTLALPPPALPPAVPRAQIEPRDASDTAYAPYNVTCPTNVTWVRNATEGLAAAEQEFVNSRQQQTKPAIETLLSAQNISAPPRTPVIGVALAGGGYRAMLTGLGGIEAMMNESTEAAASGLGGWLHGITYWAGLSGGSWATGSFMSNGGELPSNLARNLWNLESNLIFPDDHKVSFYTDLYTQVSAKSDAGFPTQITDLWGLAIGSHVLPTDYQLANNPNLTFSSLPGVVAALGNASLPMPIIIAAEREAGELVIAENATVWEFTPFEFGSWAFGSVDKSPGAFTSMEYLGTPVQNGAANGTCYKGFDQLSYVMGTSATLFNGLFLQLNASDSSSLVTGLLEKILGEIGEDQDDISRVPNTFYGYNAGENPVAELQYLTLVDAGETNQNIPIEPLLVPSRQVDAIIAFDSSYDTDTTWPNGTALRTTYERAQVLAANENTQVRMPEVPSENGFINGGYNTRPTFFGCNDTTTPVVIYVPSYPWSAAANTSTYKLSYDTDEALEVMYNGLRSLTLNGTVSTWPTCLACALSDRAFAYTAANRTAECQSCFDTWCWAGDDNTTVPELYSPELVSVPPWLLAKGLSSGAAAAPGSANSTVIDTGSGGNSSTQSAAGLSVQHSGPAAVVGGVVLALLAGLGAVL